MSQQIVFSCPSCGGSLSVDAGAYSAQCQFCGSTVAVPKGLSGQASPGNAPYSAPNASSSPAGLNNNTDRAKLAAIGDAVRAGDKDGAVRLYQEQFGADRAYAQKAVDQLAAGQSILVGTTAMGLPEYLQVSQVAPAAPYFVPMMNPVMPDTTRVFRGIMGFNIAITLAIFAFTACIIVFVFLVVGLALVPALFAGLGPLFTR